MEVGTYMVKLTARSFPGGRAPVLRGLFRVGWGRGWRERDKKM